MVPELNSTGRAVIRAYTYWMLNRPTEYMFYKELEITNPMKDKLVTAMAEKNIKRKKDYLRIGEVAPDEKLKEEKTVSNERYDVQFLPESGNSLFGGKSILYVKAIGEGGAGVQVFGEILDPDNNVLCQYRTDPYGFARVVLDAMPQGKLYATVKDTLGYEGKRVKLPDPVENGVTINGRLLVHGTSEYVQNDKVEGT